MPQPLRSLLFVPANRPDRFDKALAAGADAVILDLEDAVPPADKVKARETLTAWLQPGYKVLIRINDAGTEWFRDDIALGGMPGVAGILLPKAENADQVYRVASAGGGIAVLPIIETAIGMSQVRSIACAPHVQRLVFGTLDFQFDMGMTGEDVELLPYRAELVLASRLAKIAPPIDGVSTVIDDADAVRAVAQRGRRQGFGGKLCIHPRQVPLVNECFAPTSAEIAWAERVIEATTRSSGSAVAVDGKMVDRPVILRAEAILQEARTLDLHSGQS